MKVMHFVVSVCCADDQTEQQSRLHIKNVLNRDSKEHFGCARPVRVKKLYPQGDGIYSDFPNTGDIR